MALTAIVMSVVLWGAAPAVPPKVVAEIARAPQVRAPAADREAILAMAGAFRVSFRFEETVARGTGYACAAPYVADATELVTVIEDTGDRIALQHLLVVESGFVVKHWRQVWTYEDDDVLAFVGHETWAHRSVSEDARRGTWTQAVFQTTDAPRYEATGRWVHLAGQSSWESERTWRPLPRRERARDDYHVIECRNRHTITPQGWVHEQDNLKVALDDDGVPTHVVAHETGVNGYKRIEMDAVAAAVEYWAFYETAWHDVRAAWAPILERDRFTLQWRNGEERLDGMVDFAIDLDDADARRDVLARLVSFVVE